MKTKTHISDVFSTNQFLHIKHAEKISSTALMDLEIVGGNDPSGENREFI